MKDWTELKTLQDVAAAQARGDEIRFYAGDSAWEIWEAEVWCDDIKYRSRPVKPKTKTVVMREAVFRSMGRDYYTLWSSAKDCAMDHFVCWIDTPAREIEVPE